MIDHSACSSSRKKKHDATREILGHVESKKSARKIASLGSLDGKAHRWARCIVCVYTCVCVRGAVVQRRFLIARDANASQRDLQRTIKLLVLSRASGELEFKTKFLPLRLVAQIHMRARTHTRGVSHLRFNPISRTERLSAKLFTYLRTWQVTVTTTTTTTRVIQKRGDDNDNGQSVSASNLIASLRNLTQRRKTNK